jgi:transcriptional regulator with XRE-family HTH domain
MPDLARAAGVSKKTVQRFEHGDALKTTTVEAIQRAFEDAGVIFIEASDGGPGARLRARRQTSVLTPWGSRTAKEKAPPLRRGK